MSSSGDIFPLFIYLFIFKTGLHYVAILKSSILLPLSPECWDYRYRHYAWHIFFLNVKCSQPIKLITKQFNKEANQAA
jgi:hypothetical protein